MGDQLLRMDYVKERRMWEEEMRRRAENEADEGADTEMNNIGDDEASPTEEKEIEELVSYYNEDDLGDDGYDEAFMEVLGQDDMDMS